MSDTLLDGTAIGDIVLVSEYGFMYLGIVKKIDNNNSTRLNGNVLVEFISSNVRGYPRWIYGTFVQKLTENLVSQRRQQLAAELQELEAAWEIAKQRNT